jgi:hypothetical protein
MSKEQKPHHKSIAELGKEDARRARALSLVAPEKEPYAPVLAEQLRNYAIDPETRPQSAASAQCAGRFRRDYIRAIADLFCQPPGVDYEPVSITIVPSFGILKPSEMTSWSHARFERQLKYRLQFVQPDLLRFMAGAWDISLNIDRRKARGHEPFKTHYSVHLHAAALTSDRKALTKFLVALFPSTPGLVLRPIYVKKLEPSPYAFSYFVRDQFDRKLFTDASRRAKRDRLRTNTRDELQRILIAIGDLRPEQRGFFWRCRGRYQRGGTYSVSLLPG